MSLHIWHFVAVGLLFLLGMIAVPVGYMTGSRSFQEVSIPAEGYQIKGYLSSGTNSEGPWIVFVHGNRKQGQAHELYQRLINNLTDKVTVLAIDLRGFGQSPAEGLALSDRVLDRSEDINAAVAYLKQNHGIHDDQIILMGHSLGAVQILKAANNHRYRLLISIGFGDFEVFLTDQTRMKNYIDKFEQNTGVRLTTDAMLGEGSQLTPKALFSSCPETPIAFVMAAYDQGDTLADHHQNIPNRCQARIQWFTIPYSNHMYGTEGVNLPRPLRYLYATTSLSLLTWQLNQLLTEPIQLSAS